MDNLIKERRSVRKYSDQEVTREVLNEVIDLARFAPSWKNSQVVRYHVVLDEKIKTDIADNATLQFEFNAKTINRCKALVVVSVVTNICGFEKDGSFSTSLEDRWESFDAGIASQTFSLAAHSKGLGSVILGIFDVEKIADYISLPSDQKITALIAVGYPLEAPKTAPLRLEVEDLVTYL